MKTNNVWSGSHVAIGRDGRIVAYITVGTEESEHLRYGGSYIEMWCSDDGGMTWKRDEKLVPEEGVLYNNPKSVEHADGSEVANCLTLFGWQGKGNLKQVLPYRAASNTGRAYLWLDGEWR